MRVSKSSANSRPSDSLASLVVNVPAVILLLAVAGITAAVWSVSHGYTLYDGDAESHLDHARRVLDSRTPGPEQLGSVWLPLPHILMIPFVMVDSWWRSGAAGAIPSCACFMFAGGFLFASARRIYGSEAAALGVALLFGLNPNLLYLQSTAMTEPVQLVAVAALLWSTLFFRDVQSLWAVLMAAIASNAASMTRYESWFLIPFVTLYLLIVAKRKWHAVLFAVLASVAPLAWLAHNQYYNGNALEFYNGPYSTMAIFKRQAEQGLHYPTDHNWRVSVLTYWTASRLVIGGPLLAAAVIGTAAAFWKRALWKRVWWPLLMLALAPIFYVWSFHSGGAVLTLPQISNWSLYNTRYAIAALPLAALAAGGLVLLIPARLQLAGAAALALVAALPLWFNSNPSICLKEAEQNSETRRAWTIPAADYFSEYYRPGEGVIFTFGSGLAEVLRRAGIPLREGLHEGNGPPWEAAMTQPEKFLHEEWALATPGDPVSTVLVRAEAHGLHYQLVRQFSVKGAPAVFVYRRRPRADSLR